MHALTRDQILQAVTQFYLTSPFNGVPLADLERNSSSNFVRSRVTELIRDGLVAPVFGDRHPNRHIRAFPEHHSVDRQIELLLADNNPCLYPLPLHLERVVDRSQYAGRPYTLALALGQPQLAHRSFDLVVLEVYRNDPHYHYSSDDIQGSMSVTDESGLERAHRVFMQGFGFSFDRDLNKYVAACLRDLDRLSPEHQQLWSVREVRVETRLHPDYVRSALLGDWPEFVSAYQGFIEELQVINQMAVAIGWPRLFREDYAHRERPRAFASLLRPTSREYGEFVLLLDQLMSDNIDRSFFPSEVARFESITHSDGSVERRQFGTIKMLENWALQYFRPDDPEPIEEMCNTFREVRRLRQRPAHSIRENEFDQTFVHQQREVMTKSYRAVKILRRLLANHPLAATVELPEWLRDGKISEL